MYVCLCVGVTTRQVGECTGAGTVCGRCKNNIRALIATAAQQPQSLT